MQARFNSTLVIAEHDESKLSNVTLNAITAASKLGHEISVLVAGASSGQVAEQVSKVANVKRVLVAQDEKLKAQLPGFFLLFNDLNIQRVISRTCNCNGCRCSQSIQIFPYSCWCLFLWSRSHS